ncbi:hypothetical protein C3404_20860, partial [Citrobacter freundii complex sp. CFNIH11]
FVVGGPVGDSELLLCHGMVCVVGRMRDLILQLSKSSIYSTKPFSSIKSTCLLCLESKRGRKESSTFISIYRSLLLTKESSSKIK